jgi:group I intron endonuclease
VSQAAPINAIVYQATNRLNGHRYIGFTTQGLEKRRGQHLKDARGKRRVMRFQRALLKYGPENFEFAVMADFQDDEELAKAYECEAIAAYKPEYNLTYGGEGGTLDAETRAKISAGNLGKSRGAGVAKSAEHRQRIGDAHRGKSKPSHPHSEETRRKISVSNTGHAPTRVGPHLEATKQKLREANAGQVPWIKGKKLGEATISRMRVAAKARWENPSERRLAATAVQIAALAKRNKKPVVCVTDGRTFDSATDAAVFYGLAPKAVAAAAKGMAANVRGMMFRYAEKSE